MEIINDEVFGEMHYDLFWERKASLAWNGINHPVVLIVKVAKAQPPTPKQRECFTYFMQHSAALISTAAQKLLKYCQDNYDDQLSMDALCQQLTPKELVFRKTGRWGITFDSPWENEMRLAVAFKDDKVIAGTDDLLI